MPRTTCPRPRPVDPRSTACRLCGAPGAPTTPDGREHGPCRSARDAHLTADRARAADDLAAAYNAWAADRRAVAR